MQGRNRVVRTMRTRCASCAHVQRIPSPKAIGEEKLEIATPPRTFDVPLHTPPPLMLRSILYPALCLALFVSHARAHEAAQQMMDTAKAFLTALTPEAKAKAVFPFDSEERENW